MTNFTAPASPAGDGSTVTAVSPPPGQLGVHYYSRTAHGHVDEACVDLDCACTRLAAVRKTVDASAYLVRKTGSGVWRLYTPPAVTA